MPEDYEAALAAIKSRIQRERLRVVLAANAAMVLLYWDIGQMILAAELSRAPHAPSKARRNTR